MRRRYSGELQRPKDNPEYTSAAANLVARVLEGALQTRTRGVHFYRPGQLRHEALAGLLVALALIPEVTSFAIIAGVDPRVGLLASFTTAVAISFLGGRPAMISAAAGAVALVVAPVMRDYGYDYLIATVLLGGAIQLALAAAGIAKLMRFVPRAVTIGFVNALAVLIFSAQFEHLLNVPWAVYPLTAIGVLVIAFLPRAFTAVPAPLVAVLGLTAVVVVGGVHVPNVGDQGALPDGLPSLFVPDVPLSLDTLKIIAPYGVAMALVGLLESLLTAQLVDELTHTTSDKTREAAGQGATNLITGAFGGIGGCAMIGQTMVNVKTGHARTRLSTFLAGIFLLLLVVVFGDVVALIPMAALVAVMVMVSVETFNWRSIDPRSLKRIPKSETAIMIATVAPTIWTHNLAIGVVVGVGVAMVIFVWRVADQTETQRALLQTSDGNIEVTYRVTGALFFASSNGLSKHFDCDNDPERVVIDLSEAVVWDASAVGALDAIAAMYERAGKKVEIVGLRPDCEARYARLTGHLG